MQKQRLNRNIILTTAQSYNPSCSQTSTRKSTISGRRICWGKGLLVPSKLSYVAFQLNLGSRACVWLYDPLFPIHCCLVWFHRRRPWFTNSVGLLPELKWGSRVGFDVLIDEMLLWDWIALLSMSPVLVLQKSSVKLGFFTPCPRCFNPLDGSSAVIISGGLLKHPRQPLLPCKQRCDRPKKGLIYRIA